MSEPTGLLEAMLAVQAEAPKLPKDGTNPHFKSKFTKLETVVETVNPLLTKNKLVWSTMPSYGETGPTLRYELSFAPTGEVKAGEMPLLLSKNDAQGQGSAITYARRYALCAVLNLVADDDDDGARAAAGRSQASRDDTATAPQKKFLRTLITQNRLDAPTMDGLLKGVGFERNQDEKVNAAIDRLSREQCSSLIERIKDGAVPDGSSDVPSAEGDEFVHPPVGGEDVLGPA